MRAPDWTPGEFETLLQHSESDDQAVAELLPERSMGAVGVVRQGIHAYHREGMNRSMLSEMMIHRLGQGSVTCPVCRTRL
jgi:hypothetical protein